MDKPEITERDLLIALVRGFVEDIEDVGGVTRHPDGFLAPLGDADAEWTNLGSTYFTACGTLHSLGLRETPYPVVDGEIEDVPQYVAPDDEYAG